MSFYLLPITATLLILLLQTKIFKSILGFTKVSEILKGSIRSTIGCISTIALAVISFTAEPIGMYLESIIAVYIVTIGFHLLVAVLLISDKTSVAQLRVNASGPSGLLIIIYIYILPPTVLIIDIFYP